MLEVRGLTRRFGGLLANDDVALDVSMGEIHVVIGPNGAGKSTLINMLSGDLEPSAGKIRLDGRDITRLSAERRSLLGVGRSYQKTNIFRTFTVRENCRLAAQSRAPHPWKILRGAGTWTDTNRSAAQAIALAELDGREERIAGTLSHGEQRQLEIALSLATGPKLLLLDEPLAGMGVDESLRMVALIRKLRDDHAILLVEHDVDAVFALADRLTVMVEGKILASGEPREIRRNPEVQAAYLGEDEVEAGHADAEHGHD